MIPFLALLALPFPQTATPTHPAPGAVVATLDGAPITAGEIAPYLWEWKSREVIEELVNHRIIAAAAAKKKIETTDAEMKARMDENRALVAPNVPPGGSVDDYIAARFGGTSRFALIAKTSLLLDKLTALELKPEEWAKVSTLVFRYDGASTDSMSKAIKSADSAYTALVAGKTWDAVLRQNEKNPDVLQNGGALGWKPVTVFPESVQAQFKAPKPPTFTKPTQTSNGIQIFRLDASGAKANPAQFAELRALYVKGFRESVAKRLREAAKVEIK